MNVSVFIPMYNEESSAAGTLSGLRQILTECTDDFEIVAVDDGSRDRTAALVREHAARDPRIRLVQHERNLGYGAALRTGFKSVSKDIVFYTDADLPVDFSLLRQVLPRMKDHQVIIGYRLDRAEPLQRRVFSKIYNLVLRALFGLRVRDVNFSFKLFRKDVVDRFKDKLAARSVFIDGEVLVHLKRLGIPLYEWPVDYHPRQAGVSTLGSWRQAAFTFSEILRFRLGRLGK
jgi:glycosyltransferase involved in cell wall biosynthesis